MTPRLLSGKMLRRYSVRYRIYSWPMIYLPPKFAFAGVIAGDVGRRQQPLISVFNVYYIIIVHLRFLELIGTLDA